jgi:hypothetical protein
VATEETFPDPDRVGADENGGFEDPIPEDGEREGAGPDLPPFLG